MTLPRNRRDFLKQTALAGTGFWLANSYLPADSKSANEKLNLGIIGAGGKGASNLGSVSGLGVNIVALCDVDEERAAKSFLRYPKAKKYHDFRKMLEEQKNLDAVIVSTPDHCHAPASVMAMKLGKHVYCEKPLAHSIHEVRIMKETAAKYKVATQMGNQGTSERGLRRAVELIQAGVIGQVHEAHVWTNRPIWPQDSEALLLHKGVKAAIQGNGLQPDSVPSTLKWDLWLGPVAERPYDRIYAPFSWRGWWDFGTGALGDMACHTMNMAFMALKLEYPTAVTAESSAVNSQTAPKWAKICYEFPARDTMAPVKVFWYEGRRGNERVLPPMEYFKGEKVSDSGSLLVGDKGILFSPNDYGAKFKLLPEKNFEGLQATPETLPRSPGHHKEWILACKGGKPAMSNFNYAATLTETVLLGNVAIRTGKRLNWDAPAMKATGCPEADAFIKREYRSGYSL